MRGLRDLSPDSTLLGSLRILTSSSGKTAVSQDPDAADHTDESMRRTRLPTLREVLSRQTKAPVDLYCFYIYLQRENNVDVLDFWLDVQQHESLFRTYLKDLARQTVTSPRMTSETQHRDSSAQDPAPTSPRLAELSPDQSSRIRQALQRDWPAYLRYAQQNGSCYESLLGPLYQGNPEKDAHTKEQALAGLGIGHAPQPASGLYVEALREGYAGSTPAIRVESDDQTARDVTLARQPSQLTSQSATTMGRQASRSSVMSQTLRALYPDEANATNEPIHNHSERLQRSPSRAASRFSAFSTASSRLMRSGSICKSKTPVQPKIYRNAALTREDIIVSAERIYARYLLRGAEREIYLPEYLKVAALPSVDPDDGDSDAGGRLPDLFHKQKTFAYAQLEQESFPRFLRSKAFGNLTPLSALVRLLFGLLALWIALSLSLSFIFLDSQPRSKRIWVALPFSCALTLLLSHAYDLDPLLIFAGRSETTPFRTIKMRERYVVSLLFGRALWVTFLIASGVTILTAIFALLPGHRL